MTKRAQPARRFDDLDAPEAQQAHTPLQLESLFESLRPGRGCGAMYVASSETLPAHFLPLEDTAALEALD